MLCSKLAACILLSAFICSVESTTFHFKGRFICPNHNGREWCVSQKMVEVDELEDDIMVDWYEHCTSEKEAFIELNGSEDNDGWFDYHLEPKVIFKSTCDPSQTGEYRLDFQPVHIYLSDFTISYDILLPKGIIRKSP